MQELVFKNHIKFLLIILLAIAISSGIALIKFDYLDVPMPLLILGMLTLFMTSCFIFYPNATTGQSLQIAIMGVLINSIILLSVFLLNDYLGLPKIIIKPEFILYLNPLILAAGGLFTIITMCTGIKIEEIREEEDVVIEQPVEEQPEQEEPQRQAEKEELKPIIQEIHRIEEKKEDGDSEGLKPLEPVELDGSEEPAVVDETEKENKAPEYIPTDIRLVQAVQAKDNEQKAKIGSIGKLLVNNKNIENLIESEEITNSKTNVITTVSGEQIYEKLKDLKNELPCIKEMALIDSGGFILANDFEDPNRAQIAGALISGAYMTMQNYLSQAGILFPIRIFFETDNTNSFIVKTKEEILFSVWDKEFKHVEYGPMEELLDVEDYSSVDIMPYADLMKIENFAVADSEGKLLNKYGENGSSELFAAVSSAVFENLKVFLMNIKLFNLSKIVIFTPKHTVTIIKPQDKIVSFLTDTEEHPKVSEELLKMEDL